MRGRSRRAGLPEKLRRHTLVHFGKRATVDEKSLVGMRMHVDEARGDDEAFRIDAQDSIDPIELADRDDRIAANADILGAVSSTGAIDDAPAIN